MKQVAAAVIVESGRIFLARRRPGDPLAGLWELPGGKIEQGETPQRCLERELLEELEMSATVGSELARTVYHYEHGSFEMIALETIRTSEYEPRVHDQTRWVDPTDLASMRLAPADVVLVATLLQEGMI